MAAEGNTVILLDDRTGPPGYRTGLTLGWLPHAVLLLFLVFWFVVSPRADHPILLWLLFYEAPVVLVAGILGGVCLLGVRARPFGQGVLVATALGAVLFSLACMVASQI